MTGETATKPKKGLFSRFKKKKHKTQKSSETEKPAEPTPPPSPEPQDDARKSKSKSKKSVTKKGVPVVTGDNPEDFNPSDVRKTTPGEPAVTSKSMKKSKKKRGPTPNSIILDKAPTARESAFSGPPRYDWIDIVRRPCAFDRRAMSLVFFFWNRYILYVHEVIDKFEPFSLNNILSVREICSKY